jgi:dihydroflavonol-4-reductase
MVKVAVTGGTGFVGSHTVAALLAAGHDLRLLVRSPGRVPAALQPLGADLPAVEIVTADITEPDAVAAGLEGVDAVLHAASVYSLDPARAAEIQRVNDLGVHIVMESAVAAACDPIVHVSSILALMDDRIGRTVGPDSPVGRPLGAYGLSKARQEEYVRGLQADGHPVVITYPSPVYGPHDPNDGESVQAVRAIYGHRYTVMPEVSMPIVDVRDVAAAHAAALQPGRGPRRFVLDGHRIRSTELAEMVARASGRRLPTVRIPSDVGLAAGRLADLLRTHGIDTGISGMGVWYGTRDLHADSRATTKELGVEFRPTTETITDMVTWMRSCDRL